MGHGSIGLLQALFLFLGRGARNLTLDPLLLRKDD